MLVLRCRNCRYQDHAHCLGTPDGPEGHQCRCRQCWTREIMDLASKALEGNSLPKIRAALESVYALQFQTMVQRQRAVQRQPGIARCASCGRVVSVRRRPRLGEPVYCRGVSRCRVRAFRARQREQAARPVTVTPGQVPEAARETAPQPSRLLAGADLSAAFRVG